MRIISLAATSLFALAAATATAQTAAAGAAAEAPGSADTPVGQGDVAAPPVATSQAAATAPSGEATPGAADAPGTPASGGAGEIIVTATRRASRLSDVPIAVSAVTPQQLQNTGATDIRQLTQVAPSLLVSSTSSEAGAGGARIRGIGTVGDNPGLESSVATFIDGVYRNRAGVALTELGPVEQVEVLRGPQGTLFGRNASAGLLNITTARPDLKKFGGFLDGSYGNYDFYRIAGGVTGPIGGSGLGFRLDAVYNHRDGFIKDVISDRRFNNRDRYLIRGKLLYQPSDDLSVMLIGDFSRQKEQCCAATYLQARDVTRNADGSFTSTPSSLEALINGLTSVVPGAGAGQVLDDTYARRVAVTPGRDYKSSVKDYGGSAQVDWNLEGVGKLTSITAYREFNFRQGIDADYNNLDIIAFPDGRLTRFKTFSQELRLQGSAFEDKLDWLVGGYYSHEKLRVANNLTYGADYDQYANAYAAFQVAQVNPLGGAIFRSTGGFQGLRGFATLVGGVLGGPGVGPAVGGVVQNLGSFVGAAQDDVFDQTDNNYALFTHNIVHVTDKLSLTLGARHTWDRKSLDASLGQGATNCNTYVNNIAALRALAAANPGTGTATAASFLADQAFLPLIPVACLINGATGDFGGKRRESEWSGTAVVTWKPIDRLLTYASYSRGYKAGGFNLDRAPFLSFATGAYSATDNLGLLQFKPEKVDAYEVGVKLRGRKFDINVAGFYQRFKTFQLNAFSGTRFFVTDITGCKDDLGTTDEDRIGGNSACGSNKAGVTSKGVEIETYLYPARDVTVNMGFTLADTRYAHDLAGTADEFGNNSLDPSLSELPGGRVSNSSLYVVTGSAQFTPPVGNLRGLLYADFRYTSELNTGSDLFPEKEQNGVMTVNARIGIGAKDGRWRLEGWVQNAFNVNYKQVAFNAPLQGNPRVGSSAQALPGQTAQNLYAAYLAEPRTFGLTVRSKF